MDKNEFLKYLKTIHNAFLEDTIMDIIRRYNINMDDIGNINNFEQEVLKILLDKEQFDSLDDDGKNMIKEIIDINLFFDIMDGTKNINDLEYNEIYNTIKGNPISLCILYNTNDDSLKEKIIRDLKEADLNFYTFIKDLNEDDNKLKLVNEFLEEIPLHTKIDILQSIKSDNLKLDLIKNNSLNLSDGAIIEIFKSIESDELKLNELDGFSFDKKIILKIIESLKNDRFKMNFLKKSPFPMEQYAIMNIIRYLESDELKIKCLHDEQFQFTSYGINAIIMTLKNDELKFSEMDFNIPTYDALEIINTFEQPKFVANALNKLIVEKSINNDYNYDNYEIEKNNKILDYLLHLERNDNLEIYKNVFDKLLPFISHQYKINPDNLKQIAEMYGYDALKYINSESFVRFINEPIENINKIDYIINSLVINITDVNNVYNCLLQKKFTLENPEVINIFSSFNLAFEENNIPVIHNNIKVISSNNLILGIFKDKEFLEQIKKNGYVIEEESFSKFLEQLCTDILIEKDNEKKQNLKNVLHSITDYYIRSSREEYISKSLENIDKELNLNKIPNKDKQIRLILEKLSNDQIKAIIKKIDINKIDDECKYLLSPYGSKIIDACLDFKKNPKEYSSLEISKEELTKKYLKMFNGLLNVCYKQELFKGICEYQDIMDTYIESSKKYNIFELLSNLNYDIITDKLLTSEENIEGLKKIIDKTKIFGWGNIFDSLLSNIGFESTENLQIALLEYGYKFLEDNNDLNKVTIADIINFSSLHCTTSSINRLLFEHENCVLIVNDPPSNKSVLKKDERIVLAKEYYKKMYEREKTAIPNIYDTYNIGKDSKLRAVVGDVANPINLTYGERTGACMRIGGAGNSLFDFCTTNENGFHIRFENPSNDQFVSRVSGFRNGNTLFLNQLRYSNDPNYSDEELIECLKKSFKKSDRKNKR